VAQPVLDDLASRPTWYLVALAAYSIFLGAVALYDLRRHVIPNAAVYPAIAIAFLLAFVRPDGPWWSFLGAGVFAGGLLVAIALASRGGMGFGDAKLAALIGLMAGWPLVLVALFVAVAAGAVVGSLLIALGRIGRRDPVAFGPALAAGAVTAIVAGRPLVALLWPAFAR